MLHHDLLWVISSLVFFLTHTFQDHTRKVPLLWLNNFCLCENRYINDFPLVIFFPCFFCPPHHLKMKSQEQMFFKDPINIVRTHLERIAQVSICNIPVYRLNMLFDAELKTVYFGGKNEVPVQFSLNVLKQVTFSLGVLMLLLLLFRPLGQLIKAVVSYTSIFLPLLPMEVAMAIGWKAQLSVYPATNSSSSCVIPRRSQANY